MHRALILPLELVPVPGHGAQLSDGAPIKAVSRLMRVSGHLARAPSLNRALQEGLNKGVASTVDG